MTVSEFLRQYDSTQTKWNYKSSLKTFFTLVYPDLDEAEDSDTMLDERSVRYFGEGRDYRDDLLRFRESLEGKAPKTVLARMNAVKLFIEDNGVEIPKRTLKKLNGKRNDAITDERVPTNEELRRIVEYMPVHGKALTLVLSSSGMRLGEAMSLGKEDVLFDSSPVRIRIQEKDTKTKKHRLIFMSSEAKEAVDEFQRFREKYIEQANRRSKTYARRESNRLFPFTAENYNMIWNNALSKAGLHEKDKNTNRVTMRPHGLRKFFISTVRRFGIDEAEAMAGHQSGLVRIYANPNDQSDGDKRLAEVYLKAEQELSIYKRTAEVKRLQASVEERDRKIEETESELKKDLTKLRYENMTLMHEVSSLRDSMRVMKEQLETWRNAHLEEALQELADRFVEMKDKVNDLESFRQRVLTEETAEPNVLFDSVKKIQKSEK